MTALLLGYLFHFPFHLLGEESVGVVRTVGAEPDVRRMPPGIHLLVNESGLDGSKHDVKMDITCLKSETVRKLKSTDCGQTYTRRTSQDTEHVQLIGDAIPW